jgi:hypothetical protein
MSRTLRGVNSPLTASLRKREDAIHASTVQAPKDKPKKGSKTTKTKPKSQTLSPGDSKTTKSTVKDVKTSAVKG